MLKRLSLVFLLILAVTAPAAQSQDADAHAGPKIVYIIRHAEKPDSRDDPNLTPRGYQRADVLAHLIPDRFGRPDFLWATAPSPHSSRPLETIQPLAKSLHMTILDPYAAADVAALAHDLLTKPEYSGKTILICWHHGEIPALAKALGATGVPEAWNPQVFDRIWLLSFSAGQVQFQDLPQKALPGDSQK
ncbi:MAG TPA: histidine phosphatase family protein [Tepidisphaeraceae bacterium]|nr:histidine phosphatase family protein [Tepidisphaeraceae bacterium]